jgi:hypothetical protein
VHSKEENSGKELMSLTSKEEHASGEVISNIALTDILKDEEQHRQIEESESNRS